LRWQDWVGVVGISINGSRCVGKYFARILYNTIRNTIYNMLANAPIRAFASHSKSMAPLRGLLLSLRSFKSPSAQLVPEAPLSRVEAHHLRLISQNGYQRDRAGMLPSAPQDDFVVIPNPKKAIGLIRVRGWAGVGMARVRATLPVADAPWRASGRPWCGWTHQAQPQ